MGRIPKCQRDGFRRPGGVLTPKKVTQAATFYKCVWQTGCMIGWLSTWSLLIHNIDKARSLWSH